MPIGGEEGIRCEVSGMRCVLQVSGFLVSVMSDGPLFPSHVSPRETTNDKRGTTHTHSPLTFTSSPLPIPLFQSLYFNHFNAGIANINDIKFVAVDNDPFFDLWYHFVVLDDIS